MSYSIDAHVQIEFERTWQHRLQQTTSMLLPFVTPATINGWMTRRSQLGAGDMRLVTARNGTSQPDTSTTFVRWIRALVYERISWIDEWDDKELGLLAAPTGAHMEQHTSAYGRQIDAVIRDALGGSALTGEDAGTSTALGSAQTIEENYTGATAANTGLTWAKVAQAKYLLDTNHVPRDMGRAFVTSAEEERDLIRDVTQLTSRDYTQVQPITDGTLEGKTWMGFHWITNYEYLTETSNVRSCFAFHKKYVEFGDGERRASVDLLPQQSHSTQVRTRARMGASRMQEEGVVEVQTYHA